MFCFRQNEAALRFSYVSEAWVFDDDGTYKKVSTDPRRFTYLLGEGHRSRTAIDQFKKLKASDQIEWVRQMNSIRNRSMEIVNAELIFA